MLSNRLIEALEDRGLDTETVVRLGVDACPSRGPSWIQIPYLDGGEVVNWKYRTIWGDKEFSQEKDGKKIFWNFDCLRDETLANSTLIITEGEMDAIAAIQSGFLRTISVPDGAPAVEIGEKETAKYSYITKEFLDLIKDVKRIVLAVDGDQAGSNLMNDLAMRLDRARCMWVKYPRGCKDLNDAALRWSKRGVVATIDTAQYMRVKGVSKLSDLPPLKEQPLFSTGIPGMDPHFRVRPGDLSVVIGTPGSGKTTLLNAVTGHLAMAYQWPIGTASFEQRPQIDFKRNMRTFHSQKWNIDMNRAEEEAADKWIDEFFPIIAPDYEDEVSLEWMLERARVSIVQFGARALVIDPINEMDHIRPPDMNESDYHGFLLRSFKRLAFNFQIHVFLGIHPTKLVRNNKGFYPVPTLYDASGCYSADTEVLTADGWKSHANVTLADTVCCFDPATETLAYQRPTQIHAYPHDGEMHHYSGDSLDICVTPNHRMLVKPGWEPPGKKAGNEQLGRPAVWDRNGWEFSRSEDLRQAQYKIPLAAELKTDSGVVAAPVGMTDTLSFWSYVGWYVAEGSTSHGSPVVCQAADSAGPIQKIMEDIGVSFHATVKSSSRLHEKPMWAARVRKRQSPEFCDWIIPRCGIGAQNKHLPPETWALPVTHKQALFDALIAGDGHQRPYNPDRKRQGGCVYSTTSPRLADEVQRLAIELGRYAIVRSRAGAKPHHFRRYWVTIGHPARTERWIVVSKHRQSIPYSGKVYCLTVPTGAYVTRRNGVSSICGNSAHYYNKPDVGIIISRSGKIETTVEVAKSKYHDIIGKPGVIKVAYHPMSGRYRELDAVSDQGKFGIEPE